jgi:hypothetical protein
MANAAAKENGADATNPKILPYAAVDADNGAEKRWERNARH